MAMNSKRKSNSVVTMQQMNDGKLVFTVLGAGTVTFNPALAHEACREYAESHGWKQRLVDGAALSRNPETGRPASPEEKLEGIRVLVAHYESGTGDWSRVGTGGGGRSITIEAIARVKGVEYADAEAMIGRYAQARNRYGHRTGFVSAFA